MMQKWKSANFDVRLKLYLSVIIVLTSLTVLVVSTLSSILSITSKSRTLLQMQVNASSSSIGMMLDNMRDMTVSLMLNADTQRYLRREKFTQEEYSASVNALRNTENYILNMSQDITFVAVIRRWPDSYIFKGNPATHFETNYESGLADSLDSGRGEIRLGVDDLSSNPGNKVLTFYSPIYSTISIGRKMGSLCMGVRINRLRGALDVRNQAIPCEASLVAGDGGMILTDADESRISQVFPYRDRLIGNSGAFSADTKLYVYARIGTWNLYAISATTYANLYRDSFMTMLWLMLLILVMTFVSLMLLQKIVKRMYRSLNNLSKGMDAVSGGDMTVRLRGEDQPADIARLYTGFNSMTEHISSLMERVKEEERQVEQIHYNALQAQIHPHFLYNTLDCIRWMAMDAGNKDIAKMVKALAQYYRICLSRGKDVITLGEEIEFTGNYMIIQNIRYGDMIHFEAQIPPELCDCPIPKITLQPLVENCVNHGFKDEEQPCRITVSAERSQGAILLKVEDDGAGMTQEAIDALNQSLRNKEGGIGYGVRNVNRRLILMFGPECSLRYELNDKGGVSALIRLPDGGASCTGC